MPLPREAGRLPAPHETYLADTRARAAELLWLADQFESAQATLGDHQWVNEQLRAVAPDRPELQLTQPATVDSLSWPFSNAGLQLNNFLPRIRAFGPPILREERNMRTGEAQRVIIGR